MITPSSYTLCCQQVRQLGRQVSKAVSHVEMRSGQQVVRLEGLVRLASSHANIQSGGQGQVGRSASKQLKLASCMQAMLAKLGTAQIQLVSICFEASVFDLSLLHNNPFLNLRIHSEYKTFIAVPVQRQDSGLFIEYQYHSNRTPWISVHAPNHKVWHISKIN